MCGKPALKYEHVATAMCVRAMRQAQAGGEPGPFDPHRRTVLPLPMAASYSYGAPMLQIDTTGPLRSFTQLHALVDAVYDAGDHDELDWIEWKSSLDLAAHDQRGVVARHILGMANRDPDGASRIAGGCGYILVGVEPSNCPGVPPVDPADLEPQIERFLGDDGPTWQPLWVKRDDNHVLVVIVDPPSHGDPIRTLKSDVGRYSPGTIFVRRQGATHQANPEEVRRLTARAQPRDRAPRLRVDVHGNDGPVVVQPVDLTEEDLEEWVDIERNRLLGPLEAVQQATEEDDEEDAMPERFSTDDDRRDRTAQQSKRLAEALRLASRAVGNVRKPEDRSPEEYKQQVDEYLEQAAELLPDMAVDRHIKDGGCTVRLTATNPTDMPFREVEIELYVPGDGVLAISGTSGSQLPNPPRIWGDRWVSALPNLYGSGLVEPLARAMSIPEVGPLGPKLHIDNSGSAKLTFPPIDLAPGASVALEDFCLLMPASLSGTTTTATWTARSVHVRGVDEGFLEIRLTDAPAATTDLLDRATGG